MVYKNPKFGDKNPKYGVQKSLIKRQKSEVWKILVYKYPTDEIFYHKNQYLTIIYMLRAEIVFRKLKFFNFKRQKSVLVRVFGVH